MRFSHFSSEEQEEYMKLQQINNNNQLKNRKWKRSRNQIITQQKSNKIHVKQKTMKTSKEKH